MRELLLDTYGMILNDSILHENVNAYFEAFGESEIFQHTLDVIGVIRELSTRYEFDVDKCIIAAYLHDLGKVVRNEDQVNFCRSFGHVILKNEEDVPTLLHQIASKIIAVEIFGIRDEEILSAVGCHITLKQHPSTIEKILFIADKVSRKDKNNEILVNSLFNESIDACIYNYFEMMHDNSATLKYYHKWSQEAYGYFKGILGENG